MSNKRVPLPTKKKKVMRSLIKTVLPEEFLRLSCSVTDTTTIPSVKEKINVIHQLLKKYNIRFESLGGATNRLVIFTKSYTFKFALDDQGYRDNLIEYSICNELQPYVTKAYETNGYITIAEPVTVMTKETFRFRKSDIIKVLEILSQDYLLGDVGYIEKNLANWGIRDDGSVCILDYAYIHRATQNLFTCDVCGDGILAYDSSYSYLRCTNSTVCNASFTYLERKMIQGYQVDLDMIDEKKRESIKIPKGKVSVGITSKSGLVYSENTVLIQSEKDYTEYVKEKEKTMIAAIDDMKALDAMVDMISTDEAEVKEAEKVLDELVEKAESEVVEEVVYDGVEREDCIILDPVIEDEPVIEEDDEEAFNDDMIESIPTVNNLHVESEEQMVLDYWDEDKDDDAELSIDDLIALIDNSEGAQNIYEESQSPVIDIPELYSKATFKYLPDELRLKGTMEDEIEKSKKAVVNE